MHTMGFKRNFFLVFLMALFLLAGCHKEEAVKAEQEEKPKESAEDIVIKTDEIGSEFEETETDETKNAETKTDETDKDMVPFYGLEELTGQIESVIAPIQSSGGMAAVYVEKLDTGAQASVNSQPMQSASLIKLYIAGCVYEQMSVLKAQEAYDGETEELLRLMITISDNDSANTLVTRLGAGDPASGMAVVDQFCQSYGFLDTHMGRLMLAPNDLDDNYTSVNDCGRLLREIYTNALPGASSILALMQQQERTEKIPAGVPAEIITANKTGELSDVENDAAIIFGGNGAYTVCVMMSGLSDTYTARGIITELSAQIYQYMC